MTLSKSKIRSIYHPSKEDTWTGVNWSKVETTVAKLQHRITKANEKGQYRKVRNLQRLLAKNNFSARLKAIRTVTQNKTAKIPGIDGQLWETPQTKLMAALEHCNSHTKPLKLVPTPFGVGDKFNSKTHFKKELKSKKNQKKILIPCMSDRARKVLWNTALTPLMEKDFPIDQPINYWDTNAKIRFKLNQKNFQWVLTGTIEKINQKVNHDWLLRNIPMEKKVLKSWLKTDFENSTYDQFELESSIKLIKLTLANLTLKNFSNDVKAMCKQPFQSKIHDNKKSISVIRVKDDFIVIGQSYDQLEDVKKAVDNFLLPRGLQMKSSVINHLSNGFDFLGWTWRSNEKLRCTISKVSKIKHRAEIKYLIKTTHKSEILILKLNKKIVDWIKYHHVANDISSVCNSMSRYLYDRLIKWGLRHHSNKTKKWVFNRYWKQLNGRWTFTVSKDEKVYTLINYTFRM
uniref:Uncharacterized protein n=1 Tax=Capsosiphon fulvescens TaxID=205396 RepID=A0A3P8MUN1_9CHLO|nr:hypothetical protein Capsosi_070 [Capsosiphon fulvescens]AWX64101.1 hypothetical protein Capsosi_070 [Capsosiphon fulvescens]